MRVGQLLFGWMWLVLCLWSAVELTPVARPVAVSNAQSFQALRGMRLVPQWHCLRYRKFDLVRRCRNFRIGRRY